MIEFCYVKPLSLDKNKRTDFDGDLQKCVEI